WPIFLLCQRRVSTLAVGARVSAVGAAGDCIGQPRPAAAGDAIRRSQPVSLAGHIRLDEISGPGHFGRQTKPGLGPQRERFPADEQQCRTILDAANQSDGTVQHSWSLEDLRALSAGQFSRPVIRTHDLPAGAIYLWSKVEL